MKLMLNEDNSHFFGSRAQHGRRITKKDILDWVEQYVDSSVDTLFISPNSMKTSYRSDVWDSIWDHIEGSELPGDNAWVDGAKHLHEDGIDVYKVMTETCKEKGIECYISMRMNDTHEVSNENSYMHSKFWKDHHDYWRVKHLAGNNSFREFDYSIKEVQDYHFSLINELFERYDFDGFELDWMRFPMHFKQGYELEGQEHLTSFMRRVRKLADEYEIKKGHKIKISTRVNSRPRTALENGMDYLTWAREGLVDILVPSPFWASIDNDIPIEVWKNTLKDTNVEVAIGLELILAQAKGQYIFNTIENVRGSVISCLNRGADHIYLFNYMDSLKPKEAKVPHNEIISTSFSIDALNTESRRHVITNVDINVPGAVGESKLPRTFGWWDTFRINIGPMPPQDKKAYLILGTEADMPSELEIFFNGNAVKKTDIVIDGIEMFGIQNVFLIDNDLLKIGYNVFDINPKVEMNLLWAEIYIK